MRNGLGGFLIQGTTGSDVINMGNGIYNSVTDGDTATAFGNDVITGGSGRDIISSSGGVDRIDGGAGDDYASVSLQKLPAISFTSSHTAGQAITLASAASVVNVETLYLMFGAGNDVVNFIGNGIIFGMGAGDDTVTTGAGNDGVHGDTGNDVISTGDGNDTIDGGDGNDRIDAGAGDDTIQTGTGTNRVDAGAGNDRVQGSRGADVVNGGTGNDSIFAGGGGDTLAGGAGADAFHFYGGTAGSFGDTGIARILDFKSSEGDKIVATFFDQDPENLGGSAAIPEVTNRDPVGNGLLRVFDTAEGVLITMTSDPSKGLLLLGTTTAQLAPDFLITGL